MFKDTDLNFPSKSDQWPCRVFVAVLLTKDILLLRNHWSLWFIYPHMCHTVCCRIFVST